jgi:hypothetical protein
LSPTREVFSLTPIEIEFLAENKRTALRVVAEGAAEEARRHVGNAGCCVGVGAPAHPPETAAAIEADIEAGSNVEQGRVDELARIGRRRVEESGVR